MTKEVKIFLIIISISVIVGGLVFFVFSRPSFYKQAPREMIPEGQKEPSPLSPKAKEIMIEIYEGKIEPKSFRVKAGQEILLTIVSMEGEHSLRFEDEELAWVGGDFDEPGETLQITFTAPRKKGEYRFYCTKEGHQEKGEEGIMMVE